VNSKESKVLLNWQVLPLLL